VPHDPTRGVFEGVQRWDRVPLTVRHALLLTGRKGLPCLEHKGFCGQRPHTFLLLLCRCLLSLFPGWRLRGGVIIHKDLFMRLLLERVLCLLVDYCFATRDEGFPSFPALYVGQWNWLTPGLGLELPFTLH